MRLISCHIENFGKLSNVDIDFNGSVHKICERNGWGKTTLSSFILSMFYGLEGTNKKKYEENERKQYLPWNSGYFGGELTFEVDGKKYIILRNFGKKDNEATFQLLDASTRLESEDYSEKIGEELFGVNRESFVRTAFIGHNDIKYQGSNSVINAKVGSLSQQGDLENYDKAKAVLKDYKYALAVSVDDCTGCGNCVDVCLAKEKALTMVSYLEQTHEQKNFNWLSSKVGYKENVVNKAANVKNSQFAQPLFEFSGACAGCGETPYIKNITQLFGDRMMIANATGCSSIYGASFPASPYCTNAKGHGPAWQNSLFEDNAEFGLGMKIGSDRARQTVANLMEQAIGCGKASDEIKDLCRQWLADRENGELTRTIADKLVPLLSKSKSEPCKKLAEYKHFIPARSQWIFGGDGWAYDIGYGGLDHVLASGKNVNVLVLDTEVYSNTGGQSSKSTPAGAIAKFAASGKKIRKKDLGMMAMSYGYVYVAQVAMGASPVQYLNAIKEAEAYDGPSLVIAYAPCINHGLKAGMGLSQKEEKLAVECGYWHLYRYNPALEEQGKNPFSLDSKEPDWTKFQAFLKGEVRFASQGPGTPEPHRRVRQGTLRHLHPSRREVAVTPFESHEAWPENGRASLYY